MTDSRPYKLRWAQWDKGYVVAFATAEARQRSMDRARLMDPDLYEEHRRKYGPPVIETWEVCEPVITRHDPDLYRPANPHG